MAETEAKDPGPAVVFRRGGNAYLAVRIERKHWWDFWNPRYVERPLTLPEVMRLYQTVHKAATGIGLQLESE